MRSHFYSGQLRLRSGRSVWSLPIAARRVKFLPRFWMNPMTSASGSPEKRRSQILLPAEPLGQLRQQLVRWPCRGNCSPPRQKCQRAVIGQQAATRAGR